MKTSRVALTLAALLGLASGAVAGETRESGTIVAVRPDVVTLEVMGSWNGPGTGLARRQVRLAPDTHVRLVKRVDDVHKAAWPNDFEVTPLAVSALRPGDFVTVTLADAASNVAAAVDVFPPAE
jgi:hypothetical protein